MNYVYPELKPETRKWLFWLAKLFGKKVNTNVYMWRGKMWVTGPIEDNYV